MLVPHHQFRAAVAAHGRRRRRAPLTSELEAFWDAWRRARRDSPPDFLHADSPPGGSGRTKGTGGNGQAARENGLLQQPALRVSIWGLAKTQTDLPSGY